ncbi:sensor histidine kinase [Salimicrobium flavidum]|uniref:histidine kinase n=1 Tax=Salimicrobium flavidum TaxID=570947 RepID=A0A1N7JNV7_9BACI|nr:ATP-binding protein [Salimicrobium flavidum]SIS51053.1 two-component system, NarL family, sensor histidine kinase ComP [Salimicrobium flavidum]
MHKRWFYYFLSVTILLGVVLVIHSYAEETAHLFRDENHAMIKLHASISSYAFYLLFFIIVPSFYFLITVFISTFIHRRMPNTFSIRLLITFFLLLALGYISTGGAILGVTFNIFVNSVCFISAPILFIHFLYVYFKEVDMYLFPKKIYQFGYMILLLSLVFDIFSLMTGRTVLWMDHVQYIILLFFYFLMFGVVCFGMIRVRDTTYRSFFKYISFGVTVTFAPYVLFYLIPRLLIGTPIVGIEFAAFFLIALPITFTYLLSKEQLIDINFIFQRLRYHALISLMPSILIAFIANLIIDWSLSFVMFMQLLVSSFTVLAFVLTIAELVNFRVQRVLFSNRTNFQESLHKVTKNFKDQYSAVSLMNGICGEITETLNLAETQAYSYNTNREMFCVNDPLPEDLLYHLQHSFHNRELGVGEIVETEKGFGLVVSESLNKVTVIFSRGKQDFTTLNREEKKYLQIISMNANIAIENMSHIEDLMKQLQSLKNEHTNQYPAWLSRLLFQIAEEQRKQLSIDIHDTVLQELLYLYRRMDELYSNRQELPLTLRSELSVYKEQLLDSIHLTRETCSELRPTFLKEIGIVQSLDNLIQQYQLRSNFTVYLYAKHFHAEIDQEMMLTVYRIVQEFLSNTMKHSGAKHVHLRLEGDEEEVRLYYEDDGVGMEDNYKWDAFTHIGLSGIEHRVNGLRGSLHIDTAKGEGFRAEVRFPIQQKGKENDDEYTDY